MALLQISEPAGAKPKVALGIDLGTTNSLAAFKQQDGATKLVADANGDAIVPSVVAIREDGHLCVGSRAASKMLEPGWRVFSSIKRYMGLTAAEIGDCPYPLDASERPPRFLAANMRLSAQEISARVLQHLVRATEFEAGEIGAAVVTVPAYFDDAQRKATRDAAAIAGLPLKRLLNEPTAAAFAYGLEGKGDSHIAVFDLGGGTFDISILKCSDNLLRVLVTAGDTRLGGDDFDERLLELALKKLERTPRQLSPLQRRRLLAIARQVKQTLSNQPQAVFDFTSLAEAAGGTTAEAEEALISINADEFTQAGADLVARCTELTLNAIKDANLEGAQIDNLVLVGGATRMPQIKHSLRAALPNTNIYDALDPDTTVAIGAAQLAAALAGSNSDKTLVDVIPLSLGIETMGGLMEKIIPRNTPIPVAREQDFTTARDGQQQFLLHVLQGERELVTDCRSLARFVLKGIPPMPAGAAKLKVRFALDASGMLSVTAQEETSGVRQEVVVESTAGLDEQAITGMLKSSWRHAGEDLAERAWREAMLEAEELQTATKKALREDGDLISVEETGAIQAALEQLAQAQAARETDRLRTTNQALVAATTPFAHKRMQKVLQNSLRNRRLDELEP